MSGTVFFPEGFTLKPALDGTEKVPIDGGREFTTTSAIAELAAGVEKASLTLKANAVQTFPISPVPALLTWDAASDARGGAYVPTQHTEGIEVHRDGVYRVTARCYFGALAAGAGQIGLIVTKNGIGGTLADAHTFANPGSGEVCTRCVVDLVLSAGDVVKAYGYNVSAAPQDTFMGTPPYNQHVVPMLQVAEV